MRSGLSMHWGDVDKGDACRAKYPEESEFLFRRALVLLQLGRTEAARDVLSQADAAHPGWIELVLRFADAKCFRSAATNGNSRGWSRSKRHNQFERARKTIGPQRS